MNAWRVNITCPRCQFRGDVVEEFPCGHEAEIKRLEREASAEFQRGCDFGRQEARRLVEEYALTYVANGWVDHAAKLARVIWPDEEDW